MSRNAISANPEHYLFQVFPGEHVPEPPVEGLKKIFVAAARLENFLGDGQTKNPGQNPERIHNHFVF